MKKRLLSTLLKLCIVPSLLLGTAWAAEAPTGGICGKAVQWMLKNGVLTISGTGAMDDYAYHKVPWVNQLDSITSVTIADGVTRIGEYAFSECNNLTRVVISDSVTAIKSWAFADCGNLAYVSIPDSVTIIGAYAFEKCSSLTDISVASGNSAYVSVDGVLFSADQALLHTYPAGKSGSYSIPVSVTSIGDGAFHGAAGLTGVVIPKGVTSIGRWAFTACGSLDSITIPDSVDSIGFNAFSGTDLTTVNYTGTEAQWEAILIALNNEPLISADISYASDSPSGPAARDETLPDWYFLVAIFKNVDADCCDRKGEMTHTKYTMTQTEVEFIKKLARTFEQYMNELGVMCAHLDFVEIDDPVKELSRSDYGSWISVEQAAPFLKDKVDLDRYDHVTCAVSLNIDTGYVGITGSTFENGTGQSCLNYFNEEHTLSDFNPAFPGSVYVHEYLHFMEYTNKRWGEKFDLHGIQDNIYAPDDDMRPADEWKVCYTTIILDLVRDNTEFGTGVSPVIWQYPPHVLRTISELTVPEGVSAIGDSAFQNLTNLERVTISNSVVSIGKWAFADCSSLTRVTIPTSVTSIGAYAFEKCGSLTGIDVSEESTAYASVDGVLFSADLTLLHTYPAGKSGSYSIPASVVSIGDGAFHGAAGLTDVTIPNGVTNIGTWAFEQCGSLTSIVIPSSVTSIGSVAFQGCNSLTDVYYGGSEKQWNEIVIEEFNDALTNALIHYAVPIFSDVPENEWYINAVAWAVENKVTSGTGDGTTFSPNDDCTRSQIVTFLWRAYGEQEPTITENPFTDVKPSDYYYKAVLWAVEKGITSGTGDGTTFSPGDVCTRAQAVTFLYRAAGNPMVTGGSFFTDVPKGAWYADAVAWTVANGITSGTGNGTTFSPNDTCTRAQIVTFLYRELGQ